MFYIIVIVLFFAVMPLYFRIAERYHIVDRPNQRSSHTQLTIRGGGIIFLFAALIAWIRLPELWLPLLGLFIIGIISFLDDRITLSNKVRIFFHLVAVSLLFYHFSLFTIFPLYGLILIYIIVIGVINAYNFMDGINGITGAYSLVVLGGLQYVNLQQNAFIDAGMIWLPIMACLVFLFFNFRKKARCFAGDVGSVSIAFWIIMLLMQLILLTHNWVYILFLAVYGVDSIFTIIHRLLLKQNIFEAHNLHFYQLLVNERNMPHLFISSLYAFFQLLIIIFIIKNTDRLWLNILVCCLPLVFIYLIFKPRLMKFKRL